VPVSLLYITDITSALVAKHIELVYRDENVAVISIFCNYKDQVHQTASAVIGSIMKQLLQTKLEVSETCRQFYQQHERKGSHPSVGEYVQLLQVECTGFKHIYIIVDALDEAADDDGTRSNIITVLRSLPAYVSLMVTSRPLASIKNNFAGSKTLEILADDEDIRALHQGPRWPGKSIGTACQSTPFPSRCNNGSDCEYCAGNVSFLSATLEV
jgi:hypothetical protein